VKEIRFPVSGLRFPLLNTQHRVSKVMNIEHRTRNIEWQINLVLGFNIDSQIEGIDYDILTRLEKYLAK